MKVYRVRGDLDDAQAISFGESPAEGGYPWFDGSPKGSWSAPEELFIADKRSPVANFYTMSSDLIFDETVYQLMGDLLERAGEVFPIQVDEVGQLYILNPTLRYDAVDRDKYTPQGYVDDEPYGIKEYAFVPDKFGESSLFLLSELEPGPLFAISGRQSEDDEFVGRYRKNKLTGLSLEELWSE